jgi:hypothetical protein
MQRQNRILSASANATPSLTRPGNEVDRPRALSADTIRLHAYRKWEIAGKPAEDGITFWLEAEKELAAENEDAWGRGNSQDADRHSGLRHPHSLKM